MDNITINDEGLMEVSPTASRDNQLAFIDQYRQLQGENTAQIGTAAHALGSDLPAQLGGLHGPSEYIKSRYQTPQTESRVAALRTAAQLSALNQLMQNEQNKWANRYNRAYRNAAKRANAGGGGKSGGGGDDAIQPDIDVNVLESGTVEAPLQSMGPGTTTTSNLSWNGGTGEPGYVVTDSATGEVLQNVLPNGAKSRPYGGTQTLAERAAEGVANAFGLPGVAYDLFNKFILGRM